MKLHLAGYTTLKNDIHNLKGIDMNFLEIYPSLKNKDLSKEVKLLGKKIFLDSGAFVVASKGEEINIQDYIKFLQKNNKYLEHYAGLDVIGNPEATLKNQRIMDKAGLSAFPTYHYGSPIKYFHYLVENYNYIGIGGLVPHSHSPQKIKRCLDYCFYYIQKKGLKTRLHGWGMTNSTMMFNYPFYSVDSTSWLSGGKFGRVMFFKKNKLIGKHKSETIFKRENNYKILNKLNIQALYQYTDYITNLHKVKKMDYRNY